MYKLDKALFTDWYRTTTGEDPTQNAIETQAAMLTILETAFNVFQRGESITDLCPWFVEKV